jgi:transposase
MLVNQARSLTKTVGERLPTCAAERFHRQTQDAVPQELKPALDPVYELLDAVEQAIGKLDEEIETAAKERYPDLERVAQPKGVGLLSALVFMATIDDKHRFAKSRDVGSFIGVCPKQRQSGRGDPQLRISKAGDPFLRRLLVQCAHYILGPFGEDSDLRRWGLDLCRRGGKNAKKRALVAVTRKLSILMHRLWITGEDYQPLSYGAVRSAVPMAA